MKVTSEGIGPSRRSGVRRILELAVQDLVLFDEMYVMGLDEQLSVLSERDEQACAEVEFLAEMGFLIEAPASAGELGDEFAELLHEQHGIFGADALTRLSEAPRPIRDVLRMVSAARHPAAEGYGYRALPFGGEVLTAYMYQLTGHECVPVLPRMPTAEDWHELATLVFSLPDAVQRPRESLLDVILRTLPMPAEDIPLDDLLAFARDESTRLQRNKLFLALRRAVLDGVSAEHFSQQVEEALVTYGDHMRIAEMRTNTGIVRVSLSLLLGPMEELLHLRPKKAVDQMFELRTRSIDRLQAELLSPGNEFALIYDARRTFRYRQWDRR